MNKKLKKIIGLSLAFSAVTAIAPTTLNLGTVRAEASSRDNCELDHLDINEIDGSRIKFYDDRHCRKEDRIEDDDFPSKFYSKIGRHDKGIEISRIDPKGRDTVAKAYVDGKEIDLDDNEDEKIKISEGHSKTINIKIFEDEDDRSPEEEYTFRVYREGHDADDDDDDDDEDVYLDRLYLSYEGKDLGLDFDKDKKEYVKKLKNDVDEIKVEARPDDTDDKVRINGSRVYSDDDWKERIQLKEGNNEIKIEVTDDEDRDSKKEYTVNVERADSNGNLSGKTNTSSTKNSGWSYQNGQWYLYSANGDLCKNMWYFDSKTGKSYYITSNGTPAKGFLTINGAQHYFDSLSGEKKTGWINLNNRWHNVK